MERAHFRPLHLPSCHAVCSTCNLREICLPVGLTKDELAFVDGRLVTARRRVDRGAALYRAGDRFDSIYAVWTGFFKTCLSTADGREQVTAFQMAGELLGLDGIDRGVHEIDAIALEASQVCVIGYDDLTLLSGEIPSLREQFHHVMSREIVRHQGTMLMLGSMFAEERLAAFLLNLLHRLEQRGYSSSEVTLRMTREEIASFLGLSVETVSRTFTRFHDQGLLRVRNRQITVADAAALQRVVDHQPASSASPASAASPPSSA